MEDIQGLVVGPGTRVGHVQSNGHLRDNLQRYLQRKGTSPKQFVDIHPFDVFHHDGPTSVQQEEPIDLNDGTMIEEPQHAGLVTQTFCDRGVRGEVVIKDFDRHQF